MKDKSKLRSGDVVRARIPELDGAVHNAQVVKWSETSGNGIIISLLPFGGIYTVSLELIEHIELQYIEPIEQGN